MHSDLKKTSMLFLTSFVWGTAFVAQSLGMDHLGPLTFNAIRFLLSGVCLIPVIYYFSKKKYTNYTAEEKKLEQKNSIHGGIICGSVLFIAAAFQQSGIVYTSVANAGFISALYIIIVPILSIFLKKKIGLKIWLAVVVSIIGLYLLCIPIGKGFTDINIGDILVLASSFAFAIHILTIDHFSFKVDSLYLSGVQFLMCSGLNIIAVIFFENPSVENILLSWKAILYAGILSGCLGYTFQTIGQKGTDPAIASLILSLEAVFGAIAAYFILGEVKSLQEIIGCSVMFLAIILAQLPTKKKRSIS